MRRPTCSDTGDIPHMAVVLLASLTLLWGIQWPMMRIILVEVTPMTFRTLLPPIAALVLFGLLRATDRPIALPRGLWPGVAIAGMLNIGAWNVGTAFALTHLTSGHAVVLAYTMPVWAALFSAIFINERLTLKLLVALALGMVGIGALAIGDIHSITAAPAGIAWILFAAVAWAAGTVYLKHLGATVSVLAITGWQIIAGTIPVAIAGVAFGGIELTSPSPLVWFLLVYTVLGPHCFCYFAWFTVIRLVPTSIAAIGTLMIPVLGAVIGAIALDEPFGLKECVALASVCSAIGLVLFRPDKGGH